VAGDRVLVMKEGLSAGIHERDRLTPETLVRAATGNA
jgi:rhamnose transport system ATP-binding protein